MLFRLLILQFNTDILKMYIVCYLLCFFFLFYSNVDVQRVILSTQGVSAIFFMEHLLLDCARWKERNRMREKKKRKTDEEYRQLIMNLRIIDDIFFDEYIADADVCEELLQVVLDNPKIRIKRETLNPQKSIRIVGKRSVQVDAYVEGEEDVIYNIEIQRSDSCNHVKRVRYHASVITVKNSEPGDDFKDVPAVIVIYISEFDIFGSGKTIYHVENVIRETGEVVNDGLCSVYVNATCKDGSKLSDLMLHFMETDFSDEKFPKSSEQMRKLKHDERLVGKMCKKVQDFAETKRLEERVDAIRNMIELGLTKEQILKKYSEKEYQQAEEALRVNIL